MVSSLDASSQRFLSSLEKLQARLDNSQKQISSGKRIEKASDAPDQVSTLLHIRSLIARNTGIKQNLNRVKTEVDSGEQALSQAINLMERAAVVGAMGIGVAQTKATRATMALEIEGLMQQMVAVADTSVDGRYIFSGDADQSEPYTLDWTATTGARQLVTSTAATRQIETPNGTSFVAAHGANEIFDLRDDTGTPTGENVFNALKSLRDALLADSQADITTAVAAVRASGTYLNEQLGFYGVTQNRVSAALEDAEQSSTDLQARLAGVEDSDLTAAILELTQGRLQLDAALQARSLKPRTSLFDVL